MATKTAAKPEQKEHVNLASAMVEAQQNMKPLLNVANNPFFKSKYAPLSEVNAAAMPALNAAGIAVMQGTNIQWDGMKPKVFVNIRFVHASSGEEWAEEISMIPEKSTPQAIGSSITYARRYLLTTMAGLASMDDDGQEASQQHANSNGRRNGVAPSRQAPQVRDDLVTVWDVPESQHGADANDNGQRNGKAQVRKNWATVDEVVLPNEVSRTAMDEHLQHVPSSQPITDVQLKALHAAGTALYTEKGEWDTKRKELVKHFTQGRTDSSKKLSMQEADAMIGALNKKIHEVAPGEKVAA